MRLTSTWGLPWMHVWLGLCQPDYCRPRRFCFLHYSVSRRSFRPDISRARVFSLLAQPSLLFTLRWTLIKPHIDRPTNHVAIA